MTEKELSEILAMSVQDLSSRKVAAELNVETIPCDMHQDDKVGINTSVELTRSEDNFMVKSFPKG